MEGELVVKNENYEINKDTVALIPKSKNKTIVYEINQTFIVNKSALSIVKNSCEYFGSSLDGRKIGTKCLVGYTHKVPIIVEESDNLIFFPTKSPRNLECSWLAYSHIYKPNRLNNKVVLELKNGKKLLLDTSITSLERQLYRSSILELAIIDRKLQKNVEKAVKP